MKKLHDDWLRLGADAEIDIAAGVVIVLDGRRSKRYKLDVVYARLLQRVYQMGRNNALPYVPR